MTQQFSSDEFKKIIAKAAKKPYVPRDVKEMMKEKGLSKLFHRSVTQQQAVEVIKTLQKEGVISEYQKAPRVVRGMEKKFETAAMKTNEPSKAEMLADQRKKEDEELKEKHREATKRRMVQIYRSEREREEKIEAKKIGETATKTNSSRSVEKSNELPTQPVMDLPID